MEGRLSQSNAEKFKKEVLLCSFYDKKKKKKKKNLHFTNVF